MVKKLIFKAMLYLFQLSFNQLYNYIDKNNDGKISKEEIVDFFLLLREDLEKIKKKLR